MGTRDPRTDAYITGAAPFAQPILVHLRDSETKQERVANAVEQLSEGKSLNWKYETC